MNEWKGTESCCEEGGVTSLRLYSISTEDLGRFHWLAFNDSEGVGPWNGPWGLGSTGRWAPILNSAMCVGGWNSGQAQRKISAKVFTLRKQNP